MQRQFSFTEVIIYCLKRWLFPAVGALLGVAVMLLYTFVFVVDSKGVAYDAQITIGTIENFYDVDAVIDQADSLANITSLYNQRRSRIFEAMCSSRVYDATYDAFEAQIKSLFSLDDSEAQQFFHDNVKISTTTYTLRVLVSFDAENKAQEELCKNVADVYVQNAYASALSDDEDLRNDLNKLKTVEVAKSRVYDKEQTEKNGLLVNSVIGFIVGAVVGVAIAVIMYFASDKVKSHGDVVRFTGGRLFAVTPLTNARIAAPKIDAVLKEHSAKVIFIASSEHQARVVSDEFAVYGADADRRTLMIRVGEDGNFNEYLSGEKLENITAVTTNGACATQIAKCDVPKLLTKLDRFNELKEQFDYIILDCMYSADGDFSVLASVCDACVISIYQPSSSVKRIKEMVTEISANEKLAGVVITDPTKYFVGRGEHKIVVEE